MQERNDITKASKHIHIEYDTTCRFCQKTRAFVERRAGTWEFTFSHTDSNDSITVHTPEGTSLYKYRACMYILRRLLSPWRALGYVGAIIPAFIGDVGYDLVARYRKYL